MMIVMSLFYGDFDDSNAGLDIGITGTNGNNNSWRAIVRTKDSTTLVVL
jgi:hypothetical protein